MEVKLDGVEFKDVFSAAVIQALDAKTKETLIKEALTNLMSKTSNQWSSKTHLQELFEQAVRAHAYDSIKKMLSEDAAIVEAINGLIVDAVMKITTEKREQTVQKIADKIIEGLSPER